MTPTAAELNQQRIDTHVAETLAQTFGLLKPLEPTDHYAGHNRYWLFLCSGCGKQTTRSLSDVKRSFRRFQAVNSCPPACIRCMAKAKAVKRKKTIEAKERVLRPEPMGKFCQWCAGMPDRRPKKRPCRGCGQNYQAFVVRAEAKGLGGQPWL